MRFLYIFVINFLFYISLFSQENKCILEFGTNLGGLADWGTELPFVDMMHNARDWYSKDVGNPNGPFNSEAIDSMTFREDGYPTHLPQTVAGRTFKQSVATIWAITDGLKAGSYTIFHEGTGKLSFWGSLSNIEYVEKGKITFDLNQPKGGIIEMKIDTSLINDPIRNIRVIVGGHENTYKTGPFNPIWIEKLLAFKSVRFMDWGATNNWGQTQSWEWGDTTLHKWDDRSKMDHYTWAYNKGIPYEMMIKLMNDYDLDGWVCVPHRTSDEYIRKMAELFRDSLEPGRILTVEYSNETWNWMFGQTQWLNKYGCEEKNISWPEGIVPYIQNCMDIWTDVFDGQLGRIVRAVGVQTAWLDVSQRIVFNMDSSSFDAVTPAYYFGLSSEADEILDAKGANATVADVAALVRQWREVNEKKWILDIKEKVVDTIGKKVIFYEGGQHITPHPFGEEPTYFQALLNIQRDSSMYNLYVEWFDFLKTLQNGNEPIQLMNFSFIGQRSARYGSWGILETMDQDTNQIPAPKYKAIIEANNGCSETNYFTQNIYLHSGWNLISSNIKPLQPDSINHIMNDIKSKVLVVKDLQGNVYIPQYNINSLGKWDIEKGYLMYMSNADTLSIIGNKISPESSPINLKSGWNLISYMRDKNADIEDNLSSVSENLIIAKTIDGKVYIPSYNINTIGDQVVGNGYYLYLSNPDTLIYPSNSLGKVIQDEDLNKYKSNYLLPEIMNTGNTSSLIINIENNNGNEIGIYTENDVLIGSGKIEDNMTIINIWGDNSETEIVDGALDNEKLKLKLFDVKTNSINEAKILNIKDVLLDTNEFHFSSNSLYELTIEKENINSVSHSDNRLLISPNPAKDFISLDLDRWSPPSRWTPSEIEIYDIMGILIQTTPSASQPHLQEGNFMIDISKLPTGIYFIKIGDRVEEFVKY